MTQRPSTSVGDWRVIKVRVDRDAYLVSRWPTAARGDGDHARNIAAIGSRLTSTNTIVLE